MLAGSTIEFAPQVPCTDDELRANVAHAMRRGLPQTQVRKRLTVVANGPSAKRAPFTQGPTIAFNGALRQFTERGLAPTYWAACDPQALVADFLKDAPRETIYLVASKCHPAVFDALKGYDVRVWHVKDVDIPGALRAPLACSITMSGIWEMTRPAFGFTDFDIWGWDGCYMDGEHHAGDQAEADFRARPDYVAINYGGQVVETPDGREVVGGRNFETTHSWAMEADFAQQFHQLCAYFDIGITIHSDGMMRAMREVALA